MSGHFGGKRHEADMRLHRLSKLWCEQDWAHHEVDELHETYDNLEIRLCVPNGGYIGVSVWDTDRRLGWALTTELLAEHDNSWYSDKDRHVNLGLEAIARLRNILKPKKAVGHKPMKPSPGQMQLLDLAGVDEAIS